MGIKIKYTTVCDGCNKRIVREYDVKKDVNNSDLDGFDAWNPGIPDGWIQLSEDKITNQNYLFFHSDKCYVKWLNLQGRNKEAEGFITGVWIA
jgi:hypothetical protein